MEQKRLLLFVTLSASMLFAWQLFINPKIAPPPAAQNAVENDIQDPQDPDAPLVAIKPDIPGAKNAADEQPAPPQADLLNNPQRTILLGSLDPETGYFLQTKISTTGASLVEAHLNDPLYRDLKDPKQPLQILGQFDAGKNFKRSSLDLDVAQLDAKLAALNVDSHSANWKILDLVKDPDDPKLYQSVLLSLTAPDGSIEVQKKYDLKKYPVPPDDFREFRDTNQSGYMVHFDIKVINHGQAVQKLEYQLLGPIGIPLENAENTRKFRDLRIGFLQDDKSVETEIFTAPDIIENVNAQQVEKYSRAFQFAGVDIQYFAALLTPDGKNYDPQLVNGEMQSNYSASIEPVLVQRGLMDETQSRITVKVNSKDLELAPGGEITHSYAMYTGPKRESLLGPPLNATEIMDLGIFGPGAKLMLVCLTE